MPRKGQITGQLTCKVCGAPAYTYPSGSRVPYCRDHIRLRKAKQRGDLPTMTGPMFDVLYFLRERKRLDMPPAALIYPAVDRRTIAGLLERDWIFEFPGTSTYAIAGRGEKALAAYAKPASRRDGICPRCNVNPRNVRSGGKKDAYCKDCLKAVARQKRAKYAKRDKNARLCSRCKSAPQHRYSGGSWSTYCLECEREIGREKEVRIRRALASRIRQGLADAPLCPRCQQRPRQVFKDSVGHYCAVCLRLLRWQWKLKAVMRRKGIQP